MIKGLRQTIISSFVFLILFLSISVNAIAGSDSDFSANQTVTNQAVTNQSIAKDVSNQCSTGTLLFSEGDCLTIRVYTWSSYTHVAIVMMENGDPIVYDSMNGIGVRRLPLNEYLEREGYSSNNVVVMNPVTPLTKSQKDQLNNYLNSQLGRPYAIKHYLFGNEHEGIHCSEYVSSALRETDIIKVNRPAKVSPASLYEGVSVGKLYHVDLVSQLIRPAFEREKSDSWYQQAWLDTNFCYKVCHSKLATWSMKSK